MFLSECSLMKNVAKISLAFVIGVLLILTLLSSGTLSSENTKKTRASKLMLPQTECLRSGDLIFRHGIGFISNALKQFNLKDQRFSHVGLLHIERGEVFVYHCIGGEGNANNKLRKERLKNFCASKNAGAFGIFRADLNCQSLNGIDSLASAYYQAGLEFDTHFDLQSDDKMYCTELIYKIYEQVLKEDNFVPLTSISGKSYVSCDNIFLRKQVREVYSFSYN